MLNLIAIVTDVIMIFFLLRAPTSYFRPYRSYFVAIYGFFLAFPVREMMLFSSEDTGLLTLSTQFMVFSAVTIAIVWGHLATRLYVYPKPLSISSFISNLRRPIHSTFFLYHIPMAATFLASVLLPGAIRPGSSAYYPFSLTDYAVVGYDLVFLVVASTVIVAFVVYPLIVLTYLRSQLNDLEVRYALRLIAGCFGAISVLLLAFNAASNFGISILGPVHIASAVLLIIVVRAFSKPTFLKAFLGVVPQLAPLPATGKREHLVLIYQSQSEKFGPISRYVSEGASQNALVVFFSRDDLETIMEGFSRNRLKADDYLLAGSLRISSFRELYRGEETWDEKAPIKKCETLASEAKALGKQGLRIVIDYGDWTRQPGHEFVEHLTSSGWNTFSENTGLFMAFTRTAFQGQAKALALLRKKTRVLDLEESPDFFSRTLGLSHQEIAGRKILLEYDPLSDYEKTLNALLVESASNLERIIVFTRRDSPVHAVVGDRKGVKTFVLTARVSYPKVVEENRVLLPAYDSSLLLDAFNRTVEAYAGGSITIIFDSISHYVHTLGPARAHSLVRQALELMISERITAVFLLNSGAHDQKTISVFQGLFDFELLIRYGARVPEVRRKMVVAG